MVKLNQVLLRLEINLKSCHKTYDVKLQLFIIAKERLLDTQSQVKIFSLDFCIFQTKIWLIRVMSYVRSKNKFQLLIYSKLKLMF